MKKLFWIIVALSLLTACQPTTASTPIPTRTPTPAPKPIPSPAPGDVTADADAAPRAELAVVYGRRCGLAGTAEKWDIYACGGHFPCELDQRFRHQLVTPIAD
jgi:hypothetical protein